MALRLAVFLALFAVLTVEALGAVTVSRRSLATSSSTNTSPETATEKKEVCQGRTPCGWAVYNRMTRYIDYFMRNKCECSDNRRCLRDDDDISITAYVYRCKIDDGNASTS